ncbi:MAG: hypothetical protein AAFU49_14340 [Pseudomonadota bacterium]
MADASLEIALPAVFFLGVFAHRAFLELHIAAQDAVRDLIQRVAVPVPESLEALMEIVRDIHRACRSVR